MDAYECLTAPPFASCCNPRWCNKKHTFCAGHFGQIPSKLHQTPALEFEAPAVQLWFIIITMILSMLILCCLSLIYCPVILQETTNDFFHTNAGWPWWWSGGIPLPSWSRCTSQPSRVKYDGKASNISEGYPCNLSSLSLMRSKEGTCERTRMSAKKAQPNILVSSNPSQSPCGNDAGIHGHSPSLHLGIRMKLDNPGKGESLLLLAPLDWQTWHMSVAF